MKPQELRIGDYVRLRKNGEIVQIRSVGMLYIGFHYGKYNMRFYHKYSEIDPIPIADIYDRLPYICSLEWADKAAHKGVYLYRGVLLTKLHELQNIHHAMTGEEIEIEI